MDGNQFDRITKWMSARRTRRESVRALIGGAIGAAAAVSSAESALAGKPVKPDCCPTSAPKLCGMTCTDTVGDPYNCGGCGVTCPTGATCQNGTCACPSGQTNCGGICVSTQTNPGNCGTCGHVCPPPANGSATCAAGACGITCNGGFTKCGASCVNTANDAANCGGCGFVCPSGQSCSGGACQAPQPTCTDHIKNGNETDVDCGGGICPPCAGGQACLGDNDCIAGLFCINHICATCLAGQRACNNICVNVSTDVGNCGACGVTCSIPNGTATCIAGTCHVGACNTGFADCDNNPANGCEVNVSNDPNNCGACGHACGAGATCVNGICMGSQCAVAGDCPSTGNECVTPTCTNGFCGTLNVPGGTQTSTQTDGDCHLNVCNGSGVTTAVIDDSDLPLSANPTCATGVCNQGNASYSYASTTTVCTSSTCVGDTFYPSSHCDGVGNCTPVIALQCLPGKCTLSGCTA